MNMFVSVSILILMLHQLTDECTAVDFHTKSPLYSLNIPRRACARFEHLRIFQEYSDVKQFDYAKSKQGNGKRYLNLFLPRNNLMTIQGGHSNQVDQNRVDKNKNDELSVEEMIGIIDLRPKPETDCIILAKVEINTDPSSTDEDNLNTDERKYASVEVLMGALFSSILSDTNHHIEIPSELPTHDEDQQEAAAACLTVGSSCSTIYLIISYDFKGGKTVLHRTLGGTKLMCLVDGVRKRWHEAAASELAVTKLVLLLVPSSPSNDDEPTANIIEWCAASELLCDLSGNGSWKSDGIRFLVDRLTTYFELGGEEYKGANPFKDIPVMYVENERGQKPNAPPQRNKDDHSDLTDSMEIVLHHIREYTKRKPGVEMSQSINANEFRSLVKSRFESFGGIGGPSFL